MGILRTVFWITTDVQPGAGWQLLPMDARSFARFLWLRTLLSVAFFLVPLLTLDEVGQRPLLTGLAATSVVMFSLAAVLAILDLVLFYHLPGIRLEKRRLLVKFRGQTSVARRRYDAIAAIRQCTARHQKRDRFAIEIAFDDGTTWATVPASRMSLLGLIRLSKDLSRRTACPVVPQFDTFLAR